jgi:rhodanese-related sulfurtransferase
MNIQKNDPQKAHQFFEDKMSFTTGPVELDRKIHEATSNMAIIDVREAKDYKEAHIPGAINIPKEQWSDPQRLQKDKLNVLYCYSQVCHLAAAAAEQFSAKGYSVVEMEGGFKAWKEHNLAIETDNEGTNQSKEGKTPRWK